MKMQRWKVWLAGILLGGAALASSVAFALNAGDKAPDFGLMSSTGKEVKLADFAGRKNVVLFFYIGAFTNT